MIKYPIVILTEMIKNSGIIFQAKIQPEKKAVKLRVDASCRNQIQVRSWRKKIGFLCLSFALVGGLYFISPFVAAKISQHKAKGFRPLVTKSKSHSVKPVKELTEKVLADKKEKPKIKNFLITIEKIGLVGAKVIPSVDINDKKAYKQALSQGVAHAKGTAFPGDGKLVYIFGHSTNYAWYVSQINALFYQIEKLELGDRVKIEYNGRHYVYYVYDKQIVSPAEVESIKQGMDDDILVLQSCWPAGTALKRILLFCRPSKMGALL